jgi:hypothetical protein
VFRRPVETMVDEEISEDLLASIPEIEGEKSEVPVNPFSAFQAKKTGLPVEPVAASAGGPVVVGDISDLMLEVRKQMESAFAQQLDRVEASFGNILKDMEGKLAFATMELEAARRENERVRSEHQRKVETLRELKRTLEKI